MSSLLRPSPAWIGTPVLPYPDVKNYLSTLTAFRVILEYGTGQHGRGAKPLLFGQAQTLANEMVDAGPPIWIGDLALQNSTSQQNKPILYLMYLVGGLKHWMIPK